METTYAIQMQSAALPPAERRVAEVLVAAFADLDRETTASIASKAGVDPATVVRAARRLGFAGFRDLKLAAARRSGMTFGMRGAAVDEDESDDSVVRQLMARDANALALASRMIDTTTLSAIADTIVAAESVVCSGAGNSCVLAEHLALNLLELGLRVTWLADAQAQLLAARLLGPSGTLVVLSESARSPEVLAVARAAQASGASISLITAAHRTPLTGLADHILRVPDDPTTPRPDWFGSRAIEGAVLHALHVLVYRRRREQSDAALVAAGIDLDRHLSGDYDARPHAPSEEDREEGSG